MSFHTKPTTFIGHVTVKVENLERAETFYRDILGFAVLKRTDSTIFLTTDGETTFLSLEQPPNVIPKQARTTGLYHFALLLPKKEDLANIVVHLIENNIRFGSADHLVSEALYLHDPDGNEIEIYIDCDPSEWRWDGEEVQMAVDPLNFEQLRPFITPHKWSRIPKETLMGHIHLHVSELVKTEEFYVKGLGFTTVNRFGKQALFLSDGDYHHHIGVNTWNGEGAPKPAENSVGLTSFTLIYANEAVRQQVINNLKEIGAQVSEEGQVFRTLDPSGNNIVLAV